MQLSSVISQLFNYEVVPNEGMISFSTSPSLMDNSLRTEELDYPRYYNIENNRVNISFLHIKKKEKPFNKEKK